VAALRRRRRPSPALRRRAIAEKRAIVRASAMMSKSPARLRDEMKAQRHRVQQLEVATASIPNKQQKLGAQRALKSELQILASMVTAAKAKQAVSEAKVLPAGQIRVTPLQGRQQKRAIASTIPLVNKAIVKKKARISKLKPGMARAKELANLRALDAKKKALGRRYILLNRGRDKSRPKRLSQGEASVVRKPLVLLEAAKPVIEPGVSVAIVRSLSARIPKRKRESRQAHHHRLRSYAKRAMVRYANKECVGINPGMAVEGAVVETLSEDMSALEAEANAGGVVEDSAADAMEENVEKVSAELEDAAIEANPEASANLSSEEFVDPAAEASVKASLEAAAQAAEGGDSSSVKAEAWLAEGELAAETPQLTDVAFEELISQSTVLAAKSDPLWKNPYVIGLGIVGAVLLLGRR